MTWVGARARPLGQDAAVAVLYAAITVVPSTLAALAVAELLLGANALDSFARSLADALPAGVGPDALGALLQAADRISPATIVVAAAAGTTYGLGLRASLSRLVPQGRRDGDRPGWWVRVATLPLLGAAPLLWVAMLAVAPLLAHLPRSWGVAGTALATWLSLTWVWLLLWAPLTWAYRVVGPGRPSLAAAFAGAVAAGALISGFLQGFLVVLALPDEVAAPFGGLLPAVHLVLLLVWGWVLHIVLLAGYLFAWAWEDRAA